MPETRFADLVQKIKKTGNFDHPDFAQIGSLGESEGFDKKTVREAFFVARDIKTLEESELIDGGSGEEAGKTDPDEVLQATFSRGDEF